MNAPEINAPKVLAEMTERHRLRERLASLERENAALRAEIAKRPPRALTRQHRVRIERKKT